MGQLVGNDPVGGVVSRTVVNHDDLQWFVVNLKQMFQGSFDTAPSLCTGTTRETDGR